MALPARGGPAPARGGRRTMPERDGLNETAPTFWWSGPSQGFQG